MTIKEAPKQTSVSTESIQKKYEEIAKQNPSAISSEMFFENENSREKNEKEGRYSTPANMPSFSERLQDHLVARTASFGSASSGTKEQI